MSELGRSMLSPPAVVSAGVGGVSNEGDGGGTINLAVSVQFECRLYVVCETICPPSPQRQQ